MKRTNAASLVLPWQDEHPESEHLDRKSLRLVTGTTADYAALACSCVCFANGAGGTLLIGIEDGQQHPPADQRIDPTLPDKIRKGIGDRTVNVQVVVESRQDDNGGQYILVLVSRAAGVASTTDGRYFLRVGDTCRPVLGDDVLRLANERPMASWEAMTAIGVPARDTNPAGLARWSAAIRASDRVNASVKEKSTNELLVHYGLARDGFLTHLGVLLLGDAADRGRLGTAPVVQAIKYDERGVKVAKWVWDDYTLSPIELPDAIWSEIPDFRESYEVPDGMFRASVPAFDEAVVRELLVNALVHRPYTQRGDIFLNLHPDRLEVVNPGRLPLGVTPQNILHESRRRNDGLARVFYDLKLMEREGSGFDLMYERLLASGRAVPTVSEGTDSVRVSVPRRVVHPGVIRLLQEAGERYQLGQRERITLGLLAQSEGLTAGQLAERLDLPDTAALRTWIDRLLARRLVVATGRTKGTRYHVPPTLLRAAGLDRRTTLANVVPHRLKALIVEDLERYPDSSISEIRRRVGDEVPMRSLRSGVDQLVEAGVVQTQGERRWRRYRLQPGPPPGT